MMLSNVIKTDETIEINQGDTVDAELQEAGGQRRGDVARFSFGACRAGETLRPLFALGACGTLYPLGTCRALRSGGTLFPALAQIPFAYALYGGLAAGLFEETARLLGLRFLCRKQSSSAVIGLGYGVGHGGIEAIMLAGTAMISNVMVMAAINAGSTDALLAGLDGELYDAAVAQLQQISAIPPVEFLAGGIERLIAMTLHIALSMLIWMVVTKRLSMGFYALAVGLHALTNLPAGLYQTGVIANIWLTEALTLLIVACAAFGVWKLYQARKQAPAEG